MSTNGAPGGHAGQGNLGKRELVRGMTRVAAHVVGTRLRSPRPTSPDEVPSSPDHLTREWLNAVLCDGRPGAEVTGFYTGAVDKGATVRRPLFVDYNERGAEAGLPVRLFAKGSDSFLSRVSVGLTGIGAAEVGFYTDVRPHLDLETPEVCYAAFNPRTCASMIVLEDVSKTRGAKFADPRKTQITQALSRSQLKLLATLHGAYWNSDELPRFAWLPTATELQDRFNALIDFEARCAVGLDRSTAFVPAELVRRRDEIYPLAMRALEVQAGQPETLLHQDVHVRNWYVTVDDQMGLFDWQCVGRGLWAQDVSYAITAGLEPEDRRRWERDLIEGYLEGLEASGGPALTSDEAWTHYRQQALHGLIYWLFTIGRGPLQIDSHPRDVSEVHVRRMAHAVIDLESLDAF